MPRIVCAKCDHYILVSEDLKQRSFCYSGRPVGAPDRNILCNCECWDYFAKYKLLIRDVIKKCATLYIVKP